MEGNVISAAKGWRRPASLVRAGLAVVIASALLAGCTQAPKLAKAPEEQSRSVAEEPAGGAAPPPSPAPQASAPKPQAEPSPEPSFGDNDQKQTAPSEEQPGIERHAYRKKKAAPPPTEETESEQGAGGGAAPDSAQDEPRASGEADAPAAPAPEEPATAEAPAPVEAAPPVDETAAPMPPPPPPPAAAAPPPAAPATAARAAIEADPNKKYKVIPVFYGTDRAVEPDPARLQFGSERGHKLQLGRALITVPFVHKVPQIERPREIEIPYFKIKIYAEKEDPDKHFTVQEITSLTEDQMLALVREQIAKSSTFKDHAFVFVHGFNTSFDCALYRTAQIAYDLGFDGVPFLYSWPSGGNVASYTYDHGSVEQAEPMLAEFLDMVIQKSGAKSISLIAHSMGNELLLRVLERLRPKIPKGVVISQVILAAPDVDRDKFNIIAREITNFAKGVTLYAASNDKALGYSTRFWGGVPRAGDIPKDGPLIVPGVDTIDVSAVSTDALGLNHSGYAENPALLSDVKALVEYGIRPPNKRLNSIVAVESAAGTFWRFEASN
ncbi:MAG: alpha/beta hydrolase [Hyphomicrobium sp.]|uniref:alpha/beta hydrolase n=1 Tax=Hyphomicrobium sp. TaxID=82 RepID=UPI0039E39154